MTEIIDKYSIKSLCTAIILRAISDYKNPRIRNGMDSKERFAILRVNEWFASQSEEPFSFKFCLAVLEISPEYSDQLFQKIKNVKFKGGRKPYFTHS